MSEEIIETRPVNASPVSPPGITVARIYAASGLLPYLLIVVGGLFHGFTGYNDNGWEMLTYAALSILSSLFLTVWGILLAAAFWKVKGCRIWILPSLIGGGIGPLAFWATLLLRTVASRL